MIQLNPSIPVLTPKGAAEAIGWIDYGREHNLIWIVLLDENGQCWQFENPQIRAFPNWSLGRMIGVRPSEVLEQLKEKNKEWSNTNI